MGKVTRFAETIDSDDIIIPANKDKNLISERLSSDQRWTIKKIIAIGPKNVKIKVTDDDTPVNRHCSTIGGFPIKLGADPYLMKRGSVLNVVADNPNPEDVVVRVKLEVVRYIQLE